MALTAALGQTVLHCHITREAVLYKNQLVACRKKYMQARDGLEEDTRCILARSRDIYSQSVTLYDQTLQKPHNRIPGFLLGFQPRKLNWT